MGALPRPDLPPGPHRDLVDALHDLHHHAGWPSLRALARATGVSHTTVSKAFSTPALPSWGTLELLVEALDGDTTHFHDLWIAASSPTADPTHPQPRIAGRRAELAAVRRHLEAGTGLLLVTGEAGIGKTTLVNAACDQLRENLVLARGNCLPLSTEIPLLPFGEAFRQLHNLEEGHLLGEVLRASAPYVRSSLGALLPELLGPGDPTDPEDQWSRQRLFTAVTAALSSLSESRPCALVLEDLHWADDGTRDLVEHLLHAPRVRVLATWRLDDAHVPEDRQSWCDRIRRAASTLELGPLNLEETTAQLQYLRPEISPTAAAGIHARSRGQPLFTEQLAQVDAGNPSYLGELLDGRIRHLDGDAWRVASTLGIADRALEDETLARATGLDPERTSAALRALRDARLLEVVAESVQLRHPLLSEAVRRRLLPRESSEIHRSLAMAMSEGSGAEPAEVAVHWRGARQPDQELVWQIRAARSASRRFACARAAEHWLRVLDLWPPGDPTAGDPPLRRQVAVSEAVVQLDLSGRPTDGVPVLEGALATPADFDAAGRADLLRLLARLHSSQFGGGDHGLELIDQSLAIYRTLPASEGLAAALNWKAFELEWHGRRDEANATLVEAVQVAVEVGDVRLERSVRGQQAWQCAASGDERAVDSMDAIMALRPEGTDLMSDQAAAIRHTDVLLMACRPALTVEVAARPALDEAERWQVVNDQVLVLVSNVAQAWRRAGEVARALEVIAEHTAEEDPARPPFAHTERTLLEVLRGNTEEARRRLGHLRSRSFQALDPFVAEAGMQLDAWTGQPADAFRAFGVMLESRQDEISPGAVGDLLSLAGRAAADMAVGASPPERRKTLAALEAWRGLLHHDPYSPSAVLADRASEPQFSAEVARLAGSASVESWLVAVAEWDRLARPHDAAYCRWRAAQVAHRTGQGTLAARLLKRAAADAREHVPLSEAIARTAAGLDPSRTGPPATPRHGVP